MGFKDATRVNIFERYGTLMLFERKLIKNCLLKTDSIVKN